MKRSCLVALAAVALGGCGSTPLSVTQLRSSATRVCQAAVKQGDKIPGPGSPAASAAFLGSGLRLLKFELADLRSLRPPSSMAGNYAAATGAFSEQVSVIQGGLLQLDRGEDPVIAARLLQAQLAPIEARQAAAWQALGISACASQ